MPRAVIAVGGNALCPDPTMPFERQVETAAATAAQVAALDGYDFALTHGNGPQVGNRLLETEQTDTPALPLDVLVAETQAQLGSILQRKLIDAIPDQEFVTIVTHARVDPDDPAFDDPSKPVGPWYTEAEAADKAFETKKVTEADRPDPYRRVVPSPMPEHVLEADAIAADVAAGYGVICGGGGGVPVVQRGGTTEGVAAVIDKDHTSRLLAAEIEADELVFLTDVDHAYHDYGAPDAEPIEDATAAEMRDLLEAGAFGEGSMRPKVQASLQFLAEGGERAVICRPSDLTAALAGEAGTRVTTEA